MLSQSLGRVLEILAEHLPRWQSEDEKDLEAFLKTLKDHENAILSEDNFRVPTTNRATKIFARALMKQ